MATLPLTELRERLTDAVNGAAYKGERFVIEKHGKPVAALVPFDDFEELERLDEVEEAHARTILRARRDETSEPWTEVDARLEEQKRREEALVREA